MAQKTILFLAENGSNREFLISVLEKQYEIQAAADKTEVVSILRNSQKNISLILLFLKGQAEEELDLIDTLQADPAFASIPIIAAAQDARNEVSALAHGAVDFVTIPCNHQAILCRIGNIIQRKELAVIPDQYQYERLTGLYSKEYFYQCANEILLQDPEGEYDIVCSNFDNFKLINEAYGRQTGDQILRATADMLKKAMMGSGICSHFSADWFVCMIRHYDSYSDEMFEQITDAVNQLTPAKNIVIKWGIYVTGSRDISVEQMCDWALETARSIKGQYGKYFAYYNDELRNRLMREQEITACMETALAEGQFHVWLQPKYRMDGTPLHDAEALVRWFHPEWGIQQPGVFIPLFERNGFITKLDLYIWEEVCRMLRDWDNQETEPLNISVNVSRADIYKVDLCDILVRLTNKYGISRSRLHLEITESMFTEHPEQIVKTIRKLRKKGFVIELDDFGSGYSSLNMLNQVPMDILKLDMQFVRSEMSRPEKQGILRYVIGMAHGQNLEVVAEGVETGRQMERLKDMGCDYVQGYYTAKPMPPEDFEKLLYRRSDKIQNVREEKAPVKGDAENKEVLFVMHEDPSVRAQMQEVFQNQFQVKEAADEEAALSGIGRFGNRIRVILLDMELAQRSQSSLWNILKTEKKLWNIPVILLGNADAETEAEALKMGADDFEGMPCRNESIRMRVNNALGRNIFGSRC
ncbi:MAG: EAL domain-containing protein [Lachnospiraceae bacterium]|nr:EAL domain-containing protein [Lachnospiraceae bacterium]